MTNPQDREADFEPEIVERDGPHPLQKLYATPEFQLAWKDKQLRALREALGTILEIGERQCTRHCRCLDEAVDIAQKALK